MSHYDAAPEQCPPCENCVLMTSVKDGSAAAMANKIFTASQRPPFMSRASLGILLQMRRKLVSDMNLLTNFAGAAAICPGETTIPAQEVPNPEYTELMNRTGIRGWLAHKEIERYEVPETIITPADQERCQNQYAAALIQSGLVQVQQV